MILNLAHHEKVSEPGIHCLNNKFLYVSMLYIGVSVPGTSSSNEAGKKSDRGAGAAGKSKKNMLEGRPHASPPFEPSSSREDTSDCAASGSSSVLARRKRGHQGMFLNGPRFK